MPAPAIQGVPTCAVLRCGQGPPHAHACMRASKQPCACAHFGRVMCGPTSDDSVSTNARPVCTPEQASLARLSRACMQQCMAIPRTALAAAPFHSHARNGTPPAAWCLPTMPAAMGTDNSSARMRRTLQHPADICLPIASLMRGPLTHARTWFLPRIVRCFRILAARQHVLPAACRRPRLVLITALVARLHRRAAPLALAAPQLRCMLLGRLAGTCVPARMHDETAPCSSACCVVIIR